MAKLAFTDLRVKNLPLPEKGQRTYWDGSLPGFGVRVSQGGARSWIVLDPRAKVRIAETIGRYPLISLSAARAEAKRRLAEQTLGRHRPRSIGWSKAVEEYLGEIERKRKARTHADYKRLLNAHFKFGEMRLLELTPHDVQKKLDRLKETPAEHQHAFVVLRAFLNWAHQKHYLTESPMHRMRAPHEYVPRKRTLSDDELRKVWNASPDDNYGRIIKLLILTGQRIGEINNLSEEMIADDIVTLPAWLTKNGREHAFPLGTTAKELMVFPIKWGGFSKSKARLDKASGVFGWTHHDLRRTFRTNLGRLGVRPDIAERLVNHVSSRSDLEDVYDCWSYLPEMRAAIEKWEAHVTAITASKVGVLDKAA